MPAGGFNLVADVRMLMPSIVYGGICEILLSCGFCADAYAIHPQRLAILMPPDMCGVIIALCMLLLRCPFPVCQCPAHKHASPDSVMTDRRFSA